MMAKPFLNTFIKPGVYGDYDPCESVRYEFITEIKKLGFNPTTPEIEALGFSHDTVIMYVDGLDAILVERSKYTHIELGVRNMETRIDFKDSKEFIRNLKLKKLINE